MNRGPVIAPSTIMSFSPADRIDDVLLVANACASVQLDFRCAPSSRICESVDACRIAARNAVLYDDIDIGERHNVKERVSFDDRDVGEFSWLNGAKFAFLAEYSRVCPSERRIHLCGGHLVVDEHFCLAPRCITVEVERRAAIGSHSDYGARANPLVDRGVAPHEVEIVSVDVRGAALLDEATTDWLPPNGR